MAASPEIRVRREEGLGLGNIEMSEGIAGSTDFVSESRHRSWRHHSRLSPSFPSLPSLIPFTKSLRGSSSPSTTTKDGTMTSTLSVQRKFSLQQHHLSGDIISYPIISRIDLATTYTPSANVPTVPTVPTSEAMARSRSEQVTGSETQRRGSKTKPPPLKLAGSTHSSLLRRLGKDKAGEGEPSREELDSLLTGRRVPSQMAKERQTHAEAEARTAERDAFAPRFSGVPSNFCADKDTLSIALPPLNPPIVEQPAIHTASSIPVRALASPFASATLPSPTPSPRPRRGHRRATSEESPQIIQAASFTRVASADRLDRERPRPSTVWTTASPALIPLSQARARANAAASTAHPAVPVPETPLRRRHSRTKSISAGPKLDDAFSAPSTPSASPVCRPSAVSRPLGPFNSVGISVMDPSTGSRELGRAALGSQGLTVCLRSYHKPEEMEVGWTCVPSVDEEGRAYTQWEMRLRPRGAGAVSSSSTSTPATPSKLPVRPPTPGGSAPSASAFRDYRMNAPPLPTLPSSEDSPHPASPKSGTSTTRLSAGMGGAPSVVSPGDSRRKSSSSTSRSAPRSHNGSISSESSLFGPPTPRRRKLSAASEQAAAFDLDAMLADPSYPRPPLSASSSAFDLTNDDFSPVKIGRAASYACVAEHYRVRQFSVEQDAYLPRSASFAVDGAPQPKSPKHYRFACYIPSVADGVDFAALAAEAKGTSLLIEDQNESRRASVSAKHRRKASFAPVPKADDDTDCLPSPPASSFPASRARRRPLALPQSTLVASTTTIENSSASSPFTPPSLEHNTPIPADLRTPTMLSHTVQYPGAEIPFTRGSSMSLSPSSPISPLPADVSPALPHSVSSASEIGESSGALAGFEDDFDAEISRTATKAKQKPKQMGRMTSRWSDTEEGETDDNGEGPAQTSWSQLPDGADQD